MPFARFCRKKVCKYKLFTTPTLKNVENPTFAKQKIKNEEKICQSLAIEIIFC